ncbi:retrovirus-related pol polyprotein from transposon TNT 1-94 [Tanacetum coccineum]
MTKKFEMSMIKELTYFIGLQIKQDDKGISIYQEQYTRNLLKKYEISNSSSVKTPMVPPKNLGPNLAGKPVNETSYRGMIESLMYLTASLISNSPQSYVKISVQSKGITSNCYEKNPQVPESSLLSESLPKEAERYTRSPARTTYSLKQLVKIGNFNYPANVLAYKPIMKFLMNYPLKLAFTKCLSVLYQNLLREFWSTAIAYDLNPPVDDFVDHLLKEYLIKFLVTNGKSFTLDYKTFYSSTVLDYNNGKYVTHLSAEAVKIELGKIANHASYLHKTHIPKNSFPMAWRILFTFVILVLDENYSSTE